MMPNPVLSRYRLYNLHPILCLTYASQIGESLPAEAKRWLQYLCPTLLSELAQDTIKGTHHHCAGNASVWESPELHETFAIMNPFGSGWHLDRAVFDECLRNQVRTICSRQETQRSRLLKGRFAGVRKEGKEWAISFNESESSIPRELRCRWLVDASGRKASVGQKVRQNLRFEIFDLEENC